MCASITTLAGGSVCCKAARSAAGPSLWEDLGGVAARGHDRSVRYAGVGEQDCRVGFDGRLPAGAVTVERDENADLVQIDSAEERLCLGGW